MPVNYARRLTASSRSSDANAHLGYMLAFVAGAINAGGFLAVHRYTSHMTGVVSAMADDLVLGAHALVLGGLGALLSFMSGAACTAIMVNYGRRRALHGEYALPLMLESVLLLCFGLLGTRLADIDGLFASATVMLLSFIMGLQNALITKLSRAEIRTTHITGIVTDIGIELGKMMYLNRPAPQHAGLAPVAGDRKRLKVLSMLATCFFLGGVAGAFGFSHLGYVATLPLALALMTLAMLPLLDDVKNIATKKQ
ncbi:YoaK family protein [Massilia antarctica]|uniref:YoaK family protein n=1 Tax=Massilia antarctica TaxID=2765360 RepID=UPI0022721AAE|nr:YoaK family protein [Massilia sp. H27-R4]MCY0915278.1 YoaK family protein [Massilia sp. H27-R4]